MKKNKERCDAELFFEKYLGIESKDWNENTPTNATAGSIINMLVMYRDECVLKRVESILNKQTDKE